MVLNIQNKCRWGKRMSKEINGIFKAARKYEAEILMFFSDDPAEIIKDCIARSNVSQIVLESSDYETMSHFDDLDEKSDQVQIHILKS